MHLHDLLPRNERLGNDELLGRFLEYTQARHRELYPAQEAAILELFDDKNVILNTPTGSGKSLVATALHFQAIAQGRRSIYTCPIKALVNEKFMALCREFGPDNVGLSTGDGTVNHDAPILCMPSSSSGDSLVWSGAIVHGPQWTYYKSGPKPAKGPSSRWETRARSYCTSPPQRWRSAGRTLEAPGPPGTAHCRGRDGRGDRGVLSAADADGRGGPGRVPVRA